MNYPYKIEQNIPVPASSPREGRWQRITKHMAVGDSVLVKNTNEALALKAALKLKGYTAVTRTCRHADAFSGIRLWKMERKA